MIEELFVSEKEKQAIIEIEEIIGYKFEILDKDELFYAFPPDFYSILKPKYGWPPENDVFKEYEDINNICGLAICIENNQISGLSIRFHPKLMPIRISQLPESFKDIKFLKYLTITQHKLKNMHEFVIHFLKLEFLSLISTPLKYKPELFKSLKNLRGLDLGYYPRDDKLINGICEIPSLQMLDLSNTNLKIIPDCFQELSNLKTLDLSFRNNIHTFPGNLRELKNLEILRIHKTAMKKFPKDIQLPQNLKEIDLTINHFTELPDIFENLPNLEKIAVDGEVVANYVRKTRVQLYNEFQRNVAIKDFSNLYSLAKKKRKFLNLLLENGITSDDALHAYKGLIELQDEGKRNKKADILLNNDLMEIKSLQNDLKWICENQTTIEKVELEEEEKKVIFKLSRLNIFIGKNNSGKTFTLKRLYDKCRKINFSEYNKDIECFYIPKSRFYNNVKTTGERKGFTISIKILLDCYHKFQSDVANWSFDEAFELVTFFSSTEEEILELNQSQREIFNGFRIILKKWIDALHRYFPDINLKHPKRTDFGTLFEFDCEDNYVSALNYDFKELGSGMQELVILIFMIELLKYLPPIKLGRIHGLHGFHRMLFIDEPDISLHPELQEQFFKYLINASHRIQIILTTQSPFIPKPAINHVSVKLFRKDSFGFSHDEITNNNFVLIQEELFRYQPLEIASYLSKNNFEYFRELDYRSEEFSIGTFIDKRYNEDKNYLELLKLGTVNWEIKDRLLQDAYFLSFYPESVDLNEGYIVEESFEKNLRVFIVQIGKIPDINRNKLIKKADKLIKKYKFQLRLLTLCRTVWDKRKVKDLILSYDLDQQKSVSKKIKLYLKEIENFKRVFLGKTFSFTAVELFLLEYFGFTFLGISISAILGLLNSLNFKSLLMR